jgi:putrescine transport system substrate-binding protein
MMKQVRPHVRYFHSSQYISDLANGEICVAVGWSGDVLQAADRADEAGRGVEIGTRSPRGHDQWFDMLAIPADAPNPENAHAFINFIMEPEVAADITNYVWYPNANPPPGIGRRGDPRGSDDLPDRRGDGEPVHLVTYDAAPTGC